MSNRLADKLRGLKEALEESKRMTAQSIAQAEAKREAKKPVKPVKAEKPEKIAAPEAKGPKNDMRLERGAMNSVESLFCQRLRERYGAEFVVAAWTVKQRVLVKNMFRQYGFAMTLQAVEYYHSEWDYITLSSRGRLGGTPTVNLLWGMRDQVFSDVQTGATSFRDKLSNKASMRDEYRDGTGTEPKVGW
jgi:hypothetical protein